MLLRLLNRDYAEAFRMASAFAVDTDFADAQARPAATNAAMTTFPFASRPVQRALLTPLGNRGPHVRRGESTLKRAARPPRQGGKRQG